METAFWKGLLVASATLLVFGVSALGSTGMPDTYLDYDGGIGPQVFGMPDSYTDYDGGLPVFESYAIAIEGMPDTYTDYDGGLPVGGELIGVSYGEVEKVLADIAIAAGVTQKEMEMAEPYVADFCACSEERKILEATLTKTAQMNCRGGCFAEAAKCMREGVENGLSAEKTADVLVGSMVEVKVRCEGKGIDLQDDMFADMLHEEFEGQLAAARMPH